MRPLRNRGIAFALVVAIAVGGGSSASGAVLPTPEELPANVVAFVSEVPVDVGRITSAEFQRALVQGSAAAGRASAPKPGGKGYAELRDDAIGELLDSVWIKGQAMEMGIAVTRRQVAAELASIKRESFKTETQYRRFLRASHFTQGDVDERVELQLLSTRIQERVARGAAGPRQAQATFEKFVEAYSERWRARSVCAAEFVIDRCSNGPAPR